MTPSASSPFRAFLILCAIGFLAFLSYDMIRSPVLPLFAEQLGASPRTVGLIVAASTLTGVCMKLPVGVLSDRLGRRLFLGLGVAVFALAPWLYLAVDELWSLALLRFFHGLATAIFTPVALAVVADLFPSRRGETIGWYSALRQSGTLLGRMGGGALIDAAGFTAVFFACGSLGGFIVGLFMLLGARRSPGLAGHAPAVEERMAWSQLWAGLVEIASHARIVTTSLMQGLQMLADGVLMAFLPLYGLTVGLTPTEVGVLFGLQGVVSILARPMMGRLSDRVGRPPMIVAGLLACAAAFGLLPFTASMGTMLAPAALFGFGGAVVASATSAYVADLVHARSMGSAMGVFGMLMDVGHASGPLVGGLLIAAVGYRPAFGIIAAVLLIGTGWFLAVERAKIHAG
ncbi:MAG: MFS transporter [Nitrospirota bacterium]